jgi:hypothetical protein
MPAHITLLYPFKPPDEIDGVVLDTLRHCFFRFPPFKFSLRAINQFADETLNLVPEPEYLFRELTLAIWRCYPETPPYRGRYSTVIPHLTVADHLGEQRVGGVGPQRWRAGAHHRAIGRGADRRASLGQRFDGSLKDVFDLQDQVAASVAGVIEPALQAAETARSAHRPTSDLSAYDLYLRALAKGPTLQALQLAEEAIARDPHYVSALALAASCSMNLVNDGMAPDRDANRQKGIEFARRALAVSGDDPGVLTNAAYALAYSARTSMR